MSATQSKEKMSSFFESEYVDQASYDNLRKIASSIDGLKNSGRKVIHTAIEKNVTTNEKLSQFASKAAEFCEYLHGSLEGVVVTLAKDYSGTNNLPLLQKKGNFGTRFKNEASAARYIFVRNKPYLSDLILKDDSHILEEQYFEGSKIEPKFFVPTLPLLLINGSQGVSSGFAQNILPRDPNEIKDYLVKVLNGVKPRKFPLPSFNGFEGDVINGDTQRQFIIRGKIERKGANRVLITEVPVNYDLTGYIKVLDKLEEDKLINSYKDLSDESFKFEVRLPSKTLKALSDSELLDFFKLERRVSENYTSLNHLNKIKEYESPEEILDDYIKVKLEYTGKRKEYLLNELSELEELASSRYKFIDAVINDEIKLAKRKKQDIVKDIDELGVKMEGSTITRYDYLLRMPMSSLTIEELKRLKDEIKDIKTKIKELSKLSAKDIWLSDIAKLKF